MTETGNITEAISAYCARLTDCYTAHLCKMASEWAKRVTITHEAMPGKAYNRIARVETVNGKVISRSAVAFVKLADGSIWKPAGWKGPAKNFSRGNVFNLGEFVPWSL